jgi:hypothetical protein
MLTKGAVLYLNVEMMEVVVKNVCCVDGSESVETLTITSNIY